MSETSKPTDQDRFSRQCAAMANNRGWDLVEASNRNAEDDRAMLNSVHAACWHWSAVGTETQRGWAELLVAAAHARLGLGETALAYGLNGWAVVQESGPQAWERALALAILAHAHCAAGAGDAHAETLTLAEAAFAEIPEGPDRSIVGRSLDQVPRP